MELLSKIAQAFEHGGIWMLPIAAFQLFSFAIIIDRAIALFSKRQIDQKNFVRIFEENVRRGEIDAVIAKANAARDVHPIARAVLAGAQAAAGFGGKDEIQGKMDEVLLHENSLLDRRVSFLAMLGNVATLTGLLGTITGMIRSFAAVAAANPADKAALLSSGISEAMNCTAYGLIVAIPALVAFAILQNRSNTLSEDLNQAALKAYNWLSYSFDAVPAETSKTTTSKSSKSSSREANA
jgi:biopolymer transport protein ExbB/TolQ